MNISKEITVGLAIPVIIVVAVFLLKDVVIANYVTPTIIEQIKSKGYLNDDLKYGRYVTTTKDSFNSNHIIASEQLVFLKSEEFVLNSELSVLDENLKKIVNSSEVRTQSLITSESEKLALLKSKQNKIVEAIELLDAKIERKIAIKIYYHTDDNYRGKLRLNANNELISDLILNGKKYRVSSEMNSYDYKVQLTSLKIQGRVSYDAIANLHIEDHNKLFSNVMGIGIGDAYLDF